MSDSAGYYQNMDVFEIGEVIRTVQTRIKLAAINRHQSWYIPTRPHAGLVHEKPAGGHSCYADTAYLVPGAQYKARFPLDLEGLEMAH